MTCIPYNPTVGFFIERQYWFWQPPSPWDFHHKPGSTNIYQLKKNGTVVDELMIPNNGVLGYILFPPTTKNFLAVRHVSTFGGYDNYRIWIFKVGDATVTHYAVGSGTGPYSGLAPSQLNFQPSQDGLAFFMFIADGQNSTKQHVVFRTDTGMVLCSAGPIDIMGQRLAEITATRTVRIITSPGSGGFTTHSECLLPSGKCSVQPASQKFQAVVGGPATTKDFTIENNGNDCMTISKIESKEPFSVKSTSKALPADLNPGESMTVTVAFKPTSVGPTGPVDLPITRIPAEGEDKMRCSGTARAPNK